jgi:metal iron transporter
LRWLRAFEFFIASVVFATIISMVYLLSLIDTEEAPAGQVFLGFLPSRTVFVGDGLLETCGIIGGTIMPHTIYLGSSLVQARLRDFDVKTKHYELPEDSDEKEAKVIYRPSLAAIKSCMKYSIVELCSTLLIIAIFVNSAILIVAAASFDDDDAEEADLFALYELFAETISPTAATLFAVGLMLASMACGVVTTMAGQMVLEGAMQWHIDPFVRRLVTRCISIIPAIAIAASVGKDGLADALYACNIVLSVNLIFTCAPLLWYVCKDKYMTVPVNGSTIQGHPIAGKQKRREDAEKEKDMESVSLANGWIGIFFSGLIWFLILFMNVASWVLLGLGKIDDL